MPFTVRSLKALRFYVKETVFLIYIISVYNTLRKALLRKPPPM